MVLLMDNYYVFAFIFVIYSIGHFKVSKCFLFYSPATLEQTQMDCLRMKSANSPFYPGYCEHLLTKYGDKVAEAPNSATGPSIGRNEEIKISGTKVMSQPVLSLMATGWGWTDWNDWLSDACPEACGRRCRVRSRTCNGPFATTCKGRGQATEYENCEAVRNKDGLLESLNKGDDDDYDSVRYDDEGGRRVAAVSRGDSYSGDRRRGGSRRKGGGGDDGDDEGRRGGGGSRRRGGNGDRRRSEQRGGGSRRSVVQKGRDETNRNEESKSLDLDQEYFGIRRRRN